MKHTKEFVMLQSVVLTLTRARSNKVFRGMQLSNDKQFAQLQNGIKITNLKRRHSDEDEHLKVKFDKEKEGAADQQAATDINIEYYQEMSSLQSKHSLEEQELTQANKNKEVPIDMEIEMNNTQLQVLSNDLESYEKALENALKGGGME